MFESICIPEDIAGKLGVGPVTFRRLGQVVVLAGPNGAGKSRYLKAVAEVAERSHAAHLVLGNLRQRVEAARSARAGAALSPGWRGDVPGTAGHLEGLERKLARTTAKAAHGAFAGGSVPGKFTVAPLDYPLASGAISDPEELNRRERSAEMSRAEENFLGAYKSMHLYVGHIAQRMWDTGHAGLAGADRDEMRTETGAFNAMLSGLLGTTVEPEWVKTENRVRALLRGRPFNPDELSKGEKVLLTWAIALHKQRVVLENAMIMLDEPENHLHPDACVAAIERLRGLLGAHGQIWLATHSVPLVAYAGMASVFLIKENTATFARNKLDEVMASLLGGRDGRLHLQQMLADADRIAAARFLAECLVAPQPVDTGAADPQTRMFLTALQQARPPSGAIRVLDYGAGRGRLAAALLEVEGSVDIEYFAFNHAAHTTRETAAACRDKVAALAKGSSVERYWESCADLEAQEKRSFHVAVLCNVLHEIEPENWLTMLDSIRRLLIEEGVLLVLEDLVPAAGELPHAGGYLMLDEFGLKTLFDSPAEIHGVSERDGRLAAVAIPARCLAKATPGTRVDAIRNLLRRAKERIYEIRIKPDRDRTPEDGRAHAHFVTQFANAALALERLEGTPTQSSQPTTSPSAEGEAPSPGSATANPQAESAP